MRLRVLRILSVVAVLLLVALHNDDLLFRRGGEHLLFESDARLVWLPAELVYHVIWVAVGAAVGVLVMRCTWKGRR